MEMLNLKQAPLNLVWTADNIMEEFGITRRTYHNWIKRFDELIQEKVYPMSALLKVGDNRTTYYVSVIAFLHFLTYYRFTGNARKLIPKFDAWDIKTAYGL